MDEARIHRKNAFKAVRTVLEVLIIFAVVFAAVHALHRHRVETKTYAGRLQERTLISDEEILAGQESVGHASGPHFIAISFLNDSIINVYFIIESRVWSCHIKWNVMMFCS